jgi:hypothetical protein
LTDSRFNGRSLEPLPWPARKRGPAPANKEWNMRRYTKGAAVALLLAGTALAAGVAAADSYGNDNYRSDSYGNNHPNGAVSVQFNDVSMGYRDGYMDNNNGWHRWSNDNDYRSYRYQHANTYRDYKHDRGNSTVTIGFGNIAFGYRDGYWDNGHHWHHWRNRHDYQGYRYQNGSNFHDVNHDREHNNGWER